MDYDAARLEAAVKEVCDAMSEEDAWLFIKELPESVTPTDEWMAFYLAKKWPSIITKLRDYEY